MLFSCGTEKKRTITFSKDVKTAIKENLALIGPDAQFFKNQDGLKNAYAQNDMQPFWLNKNLTLSEEGDEFAKILYSSMDYGLDTNRYLTLYIKYIRREVIRVPPEEKLQKAAYLDVFMTNMYFRFSKDISVGIVDTLQYQSEFGKRPFIDKFEDYFVKNYNDSTMISGMLALQPQRAEYKKLQTGLANFLKEHNLSDSTVLVTPYTKKMSFEDSAAIYAKAKKALIFHEYIESEEVEDSVFLKSLKSFQINHGLEPDAKIGTNTSNALSESSTNFYKRAAVSLEKWRWTKDWEDEYVLANIATYKIKFYAQEELKQEHKVVVGAFDTQTPELDSEIKYMIAYPFWTVPESIKTDEMIPKIIQDSNYLSAHNYEILRGNQVVDMSSVNWNAVNENNFSYTIRQKGGRGNALGVIKFIFPNKHSVYFHDTPSKGKFNNDIRAYSHGCVRVHEPLRLAEYLLSRDKEVYHLDSVKATIKRKERKTIILRNKMPVHIRYFTAEGDEEGNIRFYPDIYRKEKELEEIMFGEVKI